jgi:tRNA(fMet)-specific endonuclease VapC
MAVVDSTFLIDVSKKRPSAVQLLHELEERGEGLEAPAPVLTEVMVGAYLRGGPYAQRTQSMMRTIDIIKVGPELADEAAKLGGDLMRQGTTLDAVDLLVAEVAKQHHSFVVSRDPDFSRVPGLLVSSYA